MQEDTHTINNLAFSVGFPTSTKASELPILHTCVTMSGSQTPNWILDAVTDKDLNELLKESDVKILLSCETKSGNQTDDSTNSLYDTLYSSLEDISQSSVTQQPMLEAVRSKRGRRRKYNTDEERIQARRMQQREYRKRKKAELEQLRAIVSRLETRPCTTSISKIESQITS